MKLWRKDDAGVVIVEGLGSYPLGTLVVTRSGERLNLFDTVRRRYLWQKLPFENIRGGAGSFENAALALAYVEHQLEVSPEFAGHKSYPAASIESTLTNLIDRKTEDAEAAMDYRGIFLSALGG